MAYKYDPNNKPSLDQLRGALDKVAGNFASQVMKKENWGNANTDWGTQPKPVTPTMSTPTPTTSTPTPVPQTQPQPQWTSSFQAATIDDIAKKYGFDYSRDYAKRQAELIKQQKQDGLNVAKKNVEKNLFNEADALDRNYFQQMLQTQQGQATNGINGALAADQSLRANMSRQAALGDSYRESGVQNYEIDRDLGRLDAEATAYEDELYNTRRQQGFENTMTENNFNRLRDRDSRSDFESDRGYDRGVFESDRGYDFQVGRANRSDFESDRGYNYQTGRDKVADSQWQKEYDRILGRDKRSDFESDRGYGRGVLESDRNYKSNEYWNRVGQANNTRDYNRGVLESDRGYNLDLSKFDWSKSMDSANLGLSRSRLALDRVNSTGGYNAPGAMNSDPKSKDQSYSDWIGYFAQNSPTVNGKSLQDREKEILKNKKTFEDQGYNIQAVIDAMYSGASNGFYRSKQDYTDSLNRKQKDWASIGVQALR